MKNTPRLVFYCEQCKKILDTNACEMHGVHHVQIKRMEELIEENLNPEPPEELLERPENAWLATPEQIDELDAMMPALPEDVKPEADLSPVPRGKSDDENRFPIPDEITIRPGKKIHADVIDAEFAEFDPDDEEPTPSRQKTPPPNSSKRKFPLFFILIVLIVLGAGYWGFRLFPTPAKILEQAEEKYQQQDLMGAMLLYEEFLEKYPDHPAIPEVKTKLEGLRVSLDPEALTSTGLGQKIQKLFRNANLAYQRGNLFSPPDDNAIAYLNEILKVAPHYSPAQELKNAILSSVEKEADTALKNKDFDHAITLYHNLLDVKPGDVAIMDKMQMALSRKGTNRQ
ncbi:MAG: hypothetical protein D6748_16395 [Calditrichaeota bacterium]|nr:MAG: hypothetical protein D6748_16395 [Calditrichota bacterium]